MIKKTSSLLIKASVLFACLINSPLIVAQPSGISLEQVTKDVTYLASDDLKGRGNYSNEISDAANYIAKRFKENGLIGSNDIAKQSFFQTYTVSKNSPKKLTLLLNGQPISYENLAIASTDNNVSWQVSNIRKNSKVNLHDINQSDDVQATLSKINKQGGDHIVLVNLAHEKIFRRYQHYFQQGITRLYQNENNTIQGGTIVIVLTDTAIKEIENIRVSAVNTISTSELTNVIALLPGKTKPNEIVLYSAHYDHLGMKNTEGDSIFNGADDDASGTAAIINIAGYYAKQGNNDRTLMFAAFSAEEIGGFGSQYFSKQVDPKTIIAMINIEMIGKPSKFGVGELWMTGMKHSSLGEQLNLALAKQDKKIHQDPYPEQGLFYRSDNATLAKLGVPAHSFSSTQLDKDQHYHQVSDDISSLNLSFLHKVIETLAIATQPLVNGTITPSRILLSNIDDIGLIY